MELDRQSVERRDFPISRRGYDPAAVDAHLRALAGQIEALKRSQQNSGGGETLGAAAGTQVQSILEAAEATAADIEQQATAQALRAREEAAQDAERTRSEAIARAQGHVQAVSAATTTLRERVESMDGEVSSLVQSLRAGASRITADLGSVESNIGELYDAAAGAALGTGLGVEEAADAYASAGGSLAAPPTDETLAVDSATEEHWPVDTEAPLPEGTSAQTGAEFATNGAERSEIARAPTAPSAPAPTTERPAYDDNLDGARLIALNMALNGEPREQADRYLAENFELADRAKLLDEVYAAIEG